MRHSILGIVLLLAGFCSTLAAAQRMGEDFGSHIVYSTAVLTETLAPQVARRYGITRSNQQALLNVAVEEKTTRRPYPAVPAEIEVRATNLAGQIKEIDLREVESGEYVYYIGTFSVAPRETITFELQIRPDGADETLELEFERRFLTADMPDE